MKTVFGHPSKMCLDFMRIEILSVTQKTVTLVVCLSVTTVPVKFEKLVNNRGVLKIAMQAPK